MSEDGQLALIRRLIAQLPASDLEQVEAIAADLRLRLHSGGAHAALALALVGAEAAEQIP